MNKESGSFRQMYVFTLLIFTLIFLVWFLTHEAANETMIAVLNTSIGGVLGLIGTVVNAEFQAAKARASSTRATDPGPGSVTVTETTTATAQPPAGAPK